MLKMSQSFYLQICFACFAVFNIDDSASQNSACFVMVWSSNKKEIMNFEFHVEYYFQHILRIKLLKNDQF